MRAVADAARLARSVEGLARTGGLTKTDASPVTLADFGVQALVAARLARDFPDDTLVAEEDAAALDTSTAAGLRAHVIDLVTRLDPDIQAERVLESIDRGRGAPGRRFWVLDPIDGTKGLVRGGQYAIALALIVDGLVDIGVIACPRLSLRPSFGAPAAAARGGMAVAIRGRGAWWSSHEYGALAQLFVSSTADVTRACVVCPRERSHSDRAMLDRMLGILHVASSPLPMDSQAKHVLLAAAQADLLVKFPTDPGFHDAIWDVASGSRLIEEAGGRVTDLAGQPLDFSSGRRLLHNHGLVASNGLLHDAVLTAIRGSAPAELSARLRDYSAARQDLEREP
jgi:3'(2'), 5'-bisphosphate nucleotidase